MGAKFTVNNEDTSAPAVEILTDSWYQCKVMESIRVEPFSGDSRSNYANIALCLLMHNSKHDEYANYAVTMFIAPESTDQRMYDIIRCISGKRTNFSKLKKFDIDTDVFIGKNFSIKFREEYGKIKIFLYGHVKPENRFEFDEKQYVRPPWVTRKQFYKDTPVCDELEDGIVLMDSLAEENYVDMSSIFENSTTQEPTPQESTPEKKLFDEDGFVLDDNGSRVFDEEGDIPPLESVDALDIDLSGIEIVD
jgi:hypothetical protein